MKILPAEENQHITIQRAVSGDAKTISNMLIQEAMNDNLAIPDLEKLTHTFHQILNNPNAEIWLTKINNDPIGFVQVDYLTSLTANGDISAYIEGVTVIKAYRKQGIGELLIHKIIEEAKKRNCVHVLLMMDKLRSNSLFFYRKLGFLDTHEGLILDLYPRK